MQDRWLGVALRNVNRSSPITAGKSSSRAATCTRPPLVSGTVEPGHTGIEGDEACSRRHTSHIRVGLPAPRHVVHQAPCATATPLGRPVEPEV